MVLRVCVIGAGPSGMGTLAMFKKLAGQGLDVEVTCYEKQSKTGGLWNLTWRTGLDEYGEPVHCSQYRDLFSNGPKECLEFPEYTFADHFGKPIPSFPPRAVLEDYLRGYWRFHGVKESDILCGHCVRNVRYEEGVFSVKVENLATQETTEKEFDRLIVATGHFSTPNIPNFPGFNDFNGRLLHAHDFRNAREFTGKKVLCIGSSYSAEDIALQLAKFGAEHVTISYRTQPIGFAWPQNITEVPLLQRIEDKTCFFLDGTSEEIDAIILCTGYRMNFPFMPSEYKLDCGNIYFPPNLYRGVQWYGGAEGTKDADGNLFYLGMQDQFYTFTMFMMQGLWAAHVIKGLHSPPSPEECKKQIAECCEIQPRIAADCNAQIKAQTDYVQGLADDIGYKTNLDVSELFYTWEGHKHDDIVTYRNQSFVSKYTGQVAPIHPVQWMVCFDDSLAGYLNCA